MNILINQIKAIVFIYIATHIIGAIMGRPKGSTNKPQRALQLAIEARLKRLYGKDFSVIEELADQCVKMRDTANATGEMSDRKESVVALNTLAKFLVPTLKATEISTPDEGLVVAVQRKKYDGGANDKD